MRELLKQIADHDRWFLLIAILCSLFWGIYGIYYAKNDDKKGKWQNGWQEVIRVSGYFFSEFIGSFIGWICFYALAIHLEVASDKFDVIDIFLMLGAFIGMSGWSHKIFELKSK